MPHAQFKPIPVVAPSKVKASGRPPSQKITLYLRLSLDMFSRDLFAHILIMQSGYLFRDMSSMEFLFLYSI